MKDRILKVIQRVNFRIIIAVFLIGLFVVFFVATTPPPQPPIRKPLKNIYPKYVRQVYPNLNHNDSVFNMICITINIQVIFEKGAGFSYKDNEQSANNTLQITLDGAPIVRDPGMLFIVRDLAVSRDNLGEHPISVCEPAKFTTGQHKISTSWFASNTSYTYSWTFETDEVTPIETGKENIHLQVQYDLWREQVMGN